MTNRRKIGRRKSDYLTRYLLITSLIAHIIVGSAMIAGCQSALGGEIELDVPDGSDITGPGGSVTTPVTGVEIDAITITVGETQLITGRVLPENASLKRITFKITDSSKAIIEEQEGGAFLVHGQEEGKTTITGTWVGGEVSGTAEVTVEAAEPGHIDVDSISLDQATVEMFVGETYDLKATVLPSNATYPYAIWSSTDSGIATVTYDPKDPTNLEKNGKITGVKPGVVEIWATQWKVQGKVQEKCTVTVKAPTITLYNMEVMVGQTRPLVKGDKKDTGIDYSITPDIYNNNDSLVKLDDILAMAAWSITPADDSIAKYTSGLIEGVKAGSATLSVGFGNDAPSTCTVTVKLKLPFATIEPEPAESYNFKTNYGFKLTWEKSTDSEADAVPAVYQVFDTWLEYKKLLNPLPFYDMDGDGVWKSEKSLYVFIDSGNGVMKLNNTDPDINGPIIINRYWPESASTVFDWQNSEVIRANAFKKAVAEIETMMAAITKSPLYELKDPDNNGSVPLQSTYNSMADFITYGPSTYTTRTDFSYELMGNELKAKIDPAVTGPLYEYYLGYVPPDYEYPGPVIPVVSIGSVPEKLTMFVGDTYDMKPVVLPSNATHPYVKWLSADQEIATVTYDPNNPKDTAKNGTITGVKQGKVEISAEQDGVKVTCTVTVELHPAPPTPASIIIYWQGDETVDRNGDTITWNGYSPPASSSATVKAVLSNAPAGFDYLKWTFDNGTATSADGGLHLGKTNAKDKDSSENTITANTSTATGTIHVWNCNSDGSILGTAEAWFIVQPPGNP
jgi:uncharacterized protein YjdB